MKELIGASLIAKLKPTDKAYDIWDLKLTGFILRVLPSGNMVYRCEYARGKRITIGSTTLLTPAQARDKAKEILSQSVIGILPNNEKKSQNFTLKTFIDNEYESWRLANRKNGEPDIKRLRVNFIPLCGDFLLKDISPLVIEKWRTSRINQGIQTGTVNRDIVVLKSALSKALEWGLIDDHPLTKIKPFKNDSSAKIRFLDPREEERLITTLELRNENLKNKRESGNKWRVERGHECLPNLKSLIYADYLTPMILVSLNTGLRRGELLNLQWQDINFDQAILTVRGNNAKSGKTRYIPLNSIALKALKNWIPSASDHDLVFPNAKTGEAFGHVKKSWANILTKAKITEFRWHDMRHHFASKLVMANVDLNTVRELLGHADIKMTLRYAHLAPEHKANAVAKIVSPQSQLSKLEPVLV